MSKTEILDLPSFRMIRGADVEVEVEENRNGVPVAKIIVNDGELVHSFAAKSRVSKSLKTSSPENIAERLTGGSFFQVAGQLQDFRDGNYSGFVHQDDNIARLAETVGITQRESGNTNRRVHDTNADYHLGRKWSDSGIVIPEFKEGADFNNELHYVWSPFHRTVNSAFMIYRLVCTNGMRGMKSVLNTRIPVQNRFQEHLDIAGIQIQNKLGSLVQRRMAEMSKLTASVGELQRVSDYASKRLEDSLLPSDATVARLNNIIDATSPEVHLDKVYRENVFKDKAMADQYPGHLTVLDAYNAATEISSHTPQTETASNRSLDMMANDLVFERDDNVSRRGDLREAGTGVSSFSDPDRAFFGEVD